MCLTNLEEFCFKVGISFLCFRLKLKNKNKNGSFEIEVLSITLQNHHLGIGLELR
jgi:hypothetical protein